LVSKIETDIVLKEIAEWRNVSKKELICTNINYDQINESIFQIPS